MSVPPVRRIISGRGVGFKQSGLLPMEPADQAQEREARLKLLNLLKYTAMRSRAVGRANNFGCENEERPLK
jgi:hypothetical protein